MSPSASKNAAFRSQNLNKPAGDANQEVAGGDVQERRDELRILLQASCGRALDARRTQISAPFAGVAFDEESHILSGELNWFRGTTGVFVAQIDDLRDVARVGVALCNGYVKSALAVVGNGQKDVRAGLLGFKIGSQRLRSWYLVRIGNIEGQTIRKNAHTSRQRKVAARERFLIDAQLLETPRAEIQRFQPELQHAFQKTVARLQVLWSEKSPLRPDDRLQLAHNQTTRYQYLAG